MKAGINLYSLRTSIQTEKDFTETAVKLREAGYTSMQFSGAPFDAAQIARVSKESGMPVTLTHMPMNRILNDTERLMEEHLQFGCRRIGLGMMPVSVIADEAECKKTVALLERAAEKMADNGFAFFYHHHHYEFFRHGGETVFDYILKNAPAVHFTADTYWLQYGGADVTAFFDKLKGRTECVHLKDYRIARDGEGMKPVFAPVGDGSIDFPAVVSAALAAGAREFYVEQDDACDYPDPFGQVARSIAYLKTL